MNNAVNAGKKLVAFLLLRIFYGSNDCHCRGNFTFRPDILKTDQ